MMNLPASVMNGSNHKMIRNVLIGMAILVVLVQVQFKIMDGDRIIVLDAALFGDEPADKNTAQAMDRRTEFNTRLACDKLPQENTTVHSQWFAPPELSTTRQGRPVAAPIHPCTYSYLDVGAGNGESLGWFIDAGIPTCQDGTKQAHYNTTDGTVTLQLSTVVPNEPTQVNPVTAWAYRVMMEAGHQTKTRKLEPEEYCYYGTEGNSMYRETLHQLGTLVLNSNPRPVRQVHFMTDPADTATSLTQLLQDTAKDSVGNHVMVRLHGAHAFAVLNEAFDSGILCAYASKAVRIDVLVQQQDVNQDNDNDAQRFHDSVHRELDFCGVHVILAK